MSESSADDRLKPLRDGIDALDRQLVQLLNQRAQFAGEVGRVKQSDGAPVYRPERESSVLRALAQQNEGPLSEQALSGIYREIISACRAIERPLEVAFLGPEGTFSELAMLKQFGTAVKGVSCTSIDEVFRAAETGHADFAIVPVENSTEGAVSRTLDMLLLSPLKIIAEVAIAVRHHLLTQSGTLDGVRRVLAHPQALGQCTNWLNQNTPTLERVASASNAQAARLAAQDPSSAAIAGDNAATRYGLSAVAQQIQDDAHNRTRFIVLGRQQTTPSGRDKTSLILSVPNRAGAVFHMLTPLADHGVSMTRFESRPARTGSWEYYFYVDIEGHSAEPNVAAALTALQSLCAFFKCIGSYPVGV